MWNKVSDIKPPAGIPVETKVDDEMGTRNVQVLTFKNNMWWAGGTYVYYTPTHWKSRSFTKEM